MSTDYYCLVNFELKPFSKANIHISDIGLQRGYGIFDFFRSRNGKLVWIDEYLDRIFKSAKNAKLELGFSKIELYQSILELQAANGIKNGYFKIIITGGYSEDFYTVSNHPNVIIINRPFKLPPQEVYENGANLITKRFQRSNFEIKSLNYFDSIKLQAKRIKYNAVDVLYYDKYIYEASRANIFLVKEKIIYTPKTGILNGITRRNAIKILAQKFEINIDKILAKNLYDFDEIFISGSGKDLMPITKIDGRKIANGKPGKITKKAMKMFQKSIGK